LNQKLLMKNIDKVLQTSNGVKILAIASKNSYATKRLIQEAQASGLKWEVIETKELVKNKFKINIQPYSTLYIRGPYVGSSPKYIPQIISLAKKFKKAGKKVVDANIAQGVLAPGKWIDYEKLKKAKVPIPRTVIASVSLWEIFMTSDVSAESAAAEEAEAISPKKRLPHPSGAFGVRNDEYPFVLKWTYGFGSKNVFLIHSQEEFKKIVKLHPRSEWSVQEYIDAERELEVYVVGFKAVKKILSYEIKNGFKADVKKFSIVKNSKDRSYNKIIRIAEKAAKALGREMCKVDILESGGKLFILEVNRTPGLVSFETLMGYNIARDFIKYLNRD
jgi:glutathione synthase/RimK-type ligase-like ATP-grasp enzyme